MNQASNAKRSCNGKQSSNAKQSCNANRRHRNGLGRGTLNHIAIVALFTLLAVFGPGSGPAYADIHIVMESAINMPRLPGHDDGDADIQDFFIKDGRVLIPSPEGEQLLFHCEIGEFALLTRDRSHYWQGTVAEFLAEFQATLDMIVDEPWDWADTMFGSGREQFAVPVRAVRVGTESLDGYDTVHYRVEFEQDGNWRLYEELWLAPALLQEIEAEIGPCFNDLVQEGQTAMVGLALGEPSQMWAIMTSPEYTSVFQQGFPIRSVSVVEQFGLRIETRSRVTMVRRDSLPEHMFVIPDDSESITLLEAMM